MVATKNRRHQFLPVNLQRGYGKPSGQRIGAWEKTNLISSEAALELFSKGYPHLRKTVGGSF